MDPLTIGLVIAAIFAGAGIKRAAAPPAPRGGEVGVPEEAPPSFFGFPPHTFAGNLRPPITHKAITPERVVEPTGRGGGEFGAEPASPGGLPPGLGRATSAMASGIPADFAGAPTAPGGNVAARTTRTQLMQWVTPLQGRYTGQTFLIPASQAQAQASTGTIKVLGPPVPG